MYTDHIFNHIIQMYNEIEWFYKCNGSFPLVWTTYNCFSGKHFMTDIKHSSA